MARVYEVADEVGNVYARWTVLAPAAKPAQLRGNAIQGYWLCRCQCGTEKVIHGASLRRGQSQSCGCLASEKTAARSTERNRRGASQRFNR